MQRPLHSVQHSLNQSTMLELAEAEQILNDFRFFARFDCSDGIEG